MEQLDSLTDQFNDLWQQAMAQGSLLLLPSRLWQIGILVLCALLAWGLTRWIKPIFHEWIRTLTGRPKWQLRVLVVLHRRLGLIIFAMLIWIAAAIMAEITPFLSRRFLLELVGTISVAILLVGFAARLVRNSFLRQVVTWFLWIYVTLYYLGIVDEISNFLDSLAFSFGDMRLSLLTVLQALIAIGILFTFARVATSTASERIHANSEISPSMKVLAVKFLQVLLFGAAFFIGLKVVGVDLTGLAVLSGAIGVGLGFGLQKVVSNLVSGVIILLDKSIKPGDVISIGDTFGWINALGARYVSITTRDGREYLIPNEDLITGQVVNWSHSNDFVRLDIHFGTSYKDDPHKVRKLAIEAAAGVERVLSVKPPVCHITGFGDNSVDYILRFWITDPTGGLTNIRGNVYLALWDTFHSNDISIPFPQREVRMLNDHQVPASSD
ncbi:mechanosensitive ion channel family protein [Boseongicola aestuarii]|jgi:small-conductance mechanosensitive channel|uniref:Mechanosensitive channel MscK n=1 Tax=Boseongicola aestuarii TaxID=1470561 RepID=A0A238IYY8_9RHOB|nr:Mechanosensitive channel MscK precursor [Boseongicola aestuarii]